MPNSNKLSLPTFRNSQLAWEQMRAITMPTAFSYHRVSTNVQDTKEQVQGNRRYAEENGVSVLNEYGDHGKRHHAHKRPNFQRMLADISVMKPNLEKKRG